MRNIYILVSIVGLFIASVYAAEYPWEPSNQGIFTVAFVKNVGDSYGKFNPTRVRNFEKRFGAYPAQILWEKDDLDTNARTMEHKIEWACGFVRFGTAFLDTVNVPAYQKATWGELKKWFYWELQSVRTGEVKYLPVTQGEDTTSVGVNPYLYGNYGWGMRLVVDVSDFNIPMDGSVWTVHLQAWEEPPPKGRMYQESSVAVPILHAKRSTALDTLMFAEHAIIRGTGFYLIDKSKSLNLQLLGSFPHSLALLSNLMHIFTDEGNCDSLRWAAQQYVISASQHLDTSDSLVYPWNTAGIAEKPGPYIDQIHRALKAVCGDTTLWK